MPALGSCPRRGCVVGVCARVLARRHDGNTLVSDRGRLVGIDFGFAFGKGAWHQPVPELVPFRMTRQMLGVLAPLDSQALLKRSMASVVSALRDNKLLLKQNLKIFLDDPTMDWIADSKGRAGNEGDGGEGGGGGEGAGGQGGRADGDKGFLRERMKVLDLKLDGAHPCDVMKRDVKSNKWPHIVESEQGIRAILDRARQSHKSCNLSPLEQVPLHSLPLSRFTSQSGLPAALFFRLLPVASRPIVIFL